MSRLMLALLALPLLTACGHLYHHDRMAEHGQMETHGKMAAQHAMPAMFKDGMLVAANGMTLYSFDKDSRGSGASSCYGDCAVKWPPLLADGHAMAMGDYSLISRSDGTRQWAYKGWPLYFWFADKKPGDKLGDNVGKVWHIITP